MSTRIPYPRRASQTSPLPAGNFHGVFKTVLGLLGPLRACIDLGGCLPAPQYVQHHEAHSAAMRLTCFGCSLACSPSSCHGAPPRSSDHLAMPLLTAVLIETNDCSETNTAAEHGVCSELATWHQQSARHDLNRESQQKHKATHRRPRWPSPVGTSRSCSRYAPARKT